MYLVQDDKINQVKKVRFISWLVRAAAWVMLATHALMVVDFGSAYSRMRVTRAECSTIYSQSNPATNLEIFLTCISEYRPEAGTLGAANFNSFLNSWVISILFSVGWNCHLAYILYLWWQQGKAAVMESVIDEGLNVNEGLQMNQPTEC